MVVGSNIAACSINNSKACRCFCAVAYLVLVTIAIFFGFAEIALAKNDREDLFLIISIEETSSPLYEKIIENAQRACENINHLINKSSRKWIQSQIGIAPIVGCLVEKFAKKDNNISDRELRISIVEYSHKHYKTIAFNSYSYGNYSYYFTFTGDVFEHDMVFLYITTIFGTTGLVNDIDISSPDYSFIVGKIEEYATCSAINIEDLRTISKTAKLFAENDRNFEKQFGKLKVDVICDDKYDGYCLVYSSYTRGNNFLRYNFSGTHCIDGINLDSINEKIESLYERSIRSVRTRPPGSRPTAAQ